jgi:hypothetical protein
MKRYLLTITLLLILAILPFNVFAQTSQSLSPLMKADIDNFNQFLKTFDSGYYGYVELINGTLNVHRKDGEVIYFALSDISDVQTIREKSGQLKVAFNCKDDKECVFSGKKKYQHMTFWEKGSFDSETAFSLAKNLFDHYKDDKISTKTDSNSAVSTSGDSLRKSESLNLGVIINEEDEEDEEDEEKAIKPKPTPTISPTAATPNNYDDNDKNVRLVKQHYKRQFSDVEIVGEGITVATYTGDYPTGCSRYLEKGYVYYFIAISKDDVTVKGLANGVQRDFNEKKLETRLGLKVSVLVVSYKGSDPYNFFTFEPKGSRVYWMLFRKKGSNYKLRNN